MDKRTWIKRTLMGVTALAFTGRAYPLEYYPAGSGREWAILYGTWCGSARDAAVWISEGMNGIANVFDVREDPDLSGYNNIIAGGAIRAGETSALLQEYLKKNSDIIKSRIRGYFAVCGNMEQPVGDEQKISFIDNHLAVICGVTDLPSHVFLGRITLGLMEPDVREQMQQMPGIREYDNLKRAECMEFGKEVLRAVKR